MSTDAVIPEVLAPIARRAMHPNSLAALRPMRPGETRNPTGTNRLHRQREAAQREIDRRLNQAAGQIATALIDMCMGRGAAILADEATRLKAIQYAMGRIHPTIEQGATPGGGMRFSVTWEGPAEAFAPPAEGEK